MYSVESSGALGQAWPVIFFDFLGDETEALRDQVTCPMSLLADIMAGRELPR